MFDISFEIHSGDEIWELLDKSADHILIHQFNPNEAIEWWPTAFKAKNGVLFDDILAMNMKLDIQTNLNGLKKLLEPDIYHLSIYQFDKPIPRTLSIDHLPENNRYMILKQNGLKHCFFVNFEFISVSSFDPGFINSIKNNPIFTGRIQANEPNP